MATLSKAAKLERRMRDEASDDGGLLTSFNRDLFNAVSGVLATVSRVRFPSPLYQSDPVGFFRNVLGVEPWEKQRMLLEAVRDHPRVAVSTGHKVSKSHSAAGLALWYYCSFEDARAIMTSTTARQVDQILWRELRMVRARSGRCVACKAADPEGLIIPRPCPHSAIIDGEQGELARTGLKSPDFREIVGFTAREAEAVAGISGRNLLYIVDEASGVDDAIYEAIEGNRAGGARIVMFGNPTRNEGEFFEAFNSKAKLYCTFRISSEETPNVVEGRDVIPGLATRAWIEEKKIEWGEDSPMYLVRVKGQHATGEDKKAFSIHTITESEKRWHVTPEAGRLFIGVDPAGESGTGDDTAFSARRGLKHLVMRTMRGLNDDGHIVQILGMVKSLKLPRETPVVVIDRGGSIGSSLFGRLRALLDEPAYRDTPPFELVGVLASDRALRRPDLYDRLRDELAANLAEWFRDGGAILQDVKLSKELHSFEWKQAVNGKLKITAKELLKKLLGRSPDRYDSLALAVWEPLSLHEQLPAGAQSLAANDNAHAPLAEQTFDPYSANDVWRT
jgi:phage terminase large subunit